MKHTFWEQVGEFFVKNLALILSLLAAATVKVIMDTHKKRLSFWEKVVKFALSVLIGWLTYNALHSSGQTRFEAWMPSIAAITGESVINWIMENTPRIMEAGFNFFKKKKEDNY